MGEAGHRLISRFVTCGMAVYYRIHLDRHQPGFAIQILLLPEGEAGEVPIVDVSLRPLNRPWRADEADARSAVDSPHLNQIHCSWEVAEAAFR